MRIGVSCALVGLLAGCTPATMAGFDTIEQSGRERFAISVPAWKDGKFRVNEAVGRVWRDDRRDAAGYGRDRGTGAYDAVEYGVAARFGRLAFAIERPDLGGTVEARCGYSREEIRQPLGPIRTAQPFAPLRLRCDYRIAGADAGQLALDVPDDPRAELVNGRVGRIVIDGTEVQMHSQHRIAGVGVASPEATGYLLTRPDGGTLGALVLTGGQTRRLVLSAGDRRTPALLAAITLALFWDPGDAG